MWLRKSLFFTGKSKKRALPLTALSLINIGNSNSNFEPYLGLRRVVGGPAPVLRRVQLLRLLLLPVLALLVVEPGIVKKNI